MPARSVFQKNNDRKNKNEMGEKEKNGQNKDKAENEETGFPQSWIH